MGEIEKIQERYKRREGLADRYNILNPGVYMSEQDKERRFIKWIKQCSIPPLLDKKILEIGCGTGTNIFHFIKLGFDPKNIWANDLLEERILKAKRVLPTTVNFLPGNAMDIKLYEESFDIVFQSTVFSSILDDDFRAKLASKMWSLVKPGGGVLWYDFIYNNPKNRDVKKVTYAEVRNLFPKGNFVKWKITVAPPLSRVITRIHPVMYNVFNFFPFFRSHLLLWIQKPL